MDWTSFYHFPNKRRLIAFQNVQCLPRNSLIWNLWYFKCSFDVQTFRFRICITDGTALISIYWMYMKSTWNFLILIFWDQNYTLNKFLIEMFHLYLKRILCFRGVRHPVTAVTRRNIRRQFARDRRNRHRPRMGLYGGNPPLGVPRWCVPVPRGHRRCHLLRRPVSRCRRGVREAGDGVLGRPPRGLPNAATGARLCRIVDPDVDEHHDAGGDVEGAQGGVEDVAELLAELEIRKEYISYCVPNSIFFADLTNN